VAAEQPTDLASPTTKSAPLSAGSGIELGHDAEACDHGSSVAPGGQTRALLRVGRHLPHEQLHAPEIRLPTLAAGLVPSLLVDAYMIRKVKRPDGNGLWGSYRLATDEYGTWLYTPQGSLYRGTAKGRSAICYAGHPTAPGVAVIHLVPPPGEWWFARWQVNPNGVSSVSIDVSLPPALTDREWSYVDLELDAYKASDGIAGLFDQDDFDAAVTGGHISQEEQEKAAAVASELNARVLSHDELFDDVGWVRLSAAIASSLPPITAV
jgi:hypothetical protein